MTNEELSAALSSLGLDLSEAAMLLGVSERSIRRWGEDGVPGPAAAAILAWMRLHERNLPWKPGSIAVHSEDVDQKRKHHEALLAQLKVEVEARGGPANPWNVDLVKCRATLGHAEVGFYKLVGGGFSPSTYRRRDRAPSENDKPEIADAAYCIAQAFERADRAKEALQAVASDTRGRAEFFVRLGSKTMEKSEEHQLIRRIQNQADRLDALAKEAGEGNCNYQQFEAILTTLHKLAFFPQDELVSQVARAMLGAPFDIFRNAAAMAARRGHR